MKLRVSLDLNAVIVAVRRESPRILTARNDTKRKNARDSMDFHGSYWKKNLCNPSNPWRFDKCQCASICVVAYIS